MFSERIEQTPFGVEFSEFSKIRQSRTLFDKSLLTTARAALLPRMGDDSIELQEFSSNSSERVANFGRIVDYYLHSDNGVLRFVSNINLRDDSLFEQAYSACADACTEESRWKLVPRVREFFAGKMNVLALMCESNKSVVVLFSSSSMDYWHMLQSALLAFTPWYVNKEEGITENERAMFDALKNGTIDEYNAAIEAIYKEHQYHEKFLNESLSGFNIIQLEQQMHVLENDIENYEQEIQDTIDRAARYTTALRTKRAQLLGLQITVQQAANENEILDYFKNSKFVELVSASKNDGGTIEFYAFGELAYWNEDEAERMIDNNQSLIYTHAPRNRYVSKNDMKSLMTAIFVDKIISVRSIAMYRMNGGGSVNGIAGARYPSKFHDYLPNQHIDRYHCIGSYDAVFRDAIANGDFIPVVEEAIASMRSLNFGDSTIMDLFMERMYTDMRKFINLPDGTNVCPAEAVAYLKKSGYIKEKEDEEDGETD